MEADNDGQHNLKLVLMGKSGAGKSSMESMIFTNMTAQETNHIGFTLDVHERKFNFLGMTLMINDYAG